jgi:hypothetical protein
MVKPQAYLTYRISGNKAVLHGMNNYVTERLTGHLQTNYSDGLAGLVRIIENG